jgi:drug/metabolite transporter (DMT)-like permease
MISAPKKVYLFLGLGLLAASQSGNIIRLGEANLVAIAAWRLGLAGLILAPMAGPNLSELRKIGRTDLALLCLSGGVLALHFFTWIGAVQNTTVANAAIFFSINPVITATAGYFFFGEKLSPRFILAIILGLAGIVILGGNDLALKPENFAGDILALICAVLFSLYLLLGKRLRAILSNTVYVSSVYTVAAAVSFICLILLDQPILDYNAITWLCFILMALLPTVLGHTSFNYALRYINAGRISAATLSEPLLAGIGAFLAWGETITWQAIGGYILISLSVLALVTDQDSAS